MFITESGGLEFTSSKPGAAEIRIITPGTGSSGVYPQATLEKAAEENVFRAGTQMFIDHPSESEQWERPERSLRVLAGVLTTDARWDGEGLVAEAFIFPQWKDFIAPMAEHIGVSIRAAAEAHTNEQTGETIIDRIVRAESVDFVTKAGRGGKIMKLYESALPERIVIETSIQEQRKAGEMEIKEAEYKELQEKAAKAEKLPELVGKVKELETALAEAKTKAERQAAEAVIAEAGVFTALEKRGLLADLPVTDGVLDLEKFKGIVAEAKAEKEAAAGEGNPQGVGTVVTESADDISQAELDKILGI